MFNHDDLSAIRIGRQNPETRDQVALPNREYRYAADPWADRRQPPDRYLVTQEVRMRLAAIAQRRQWLEADIPEWGRRLSPMPSMGETVLALATLDDASPCKLACEWRAGLAT